MASIKQYKGPQRATVKRKGHGVLAKHFPTKDEAEPWAGEQERSIRLAGLSRFLVRRETYSVLGMQCQ
jgi:hypothetical protein